MNTPNDSPPLSLARTELSRGTLDERIALAERRLVTREQALRQGAHALLQRAQNAAEPRRLVRPTVYALGAISLVWGALRLLPSRRGAKRIIGTTSVPTATPAAPAASGFAEVPWVRAAALLWPLLPVAWRGRMGPETASILIAVGVPLAGLLLRKRRRAQLPPQGD